MLNVTLFVPLSATFENLTPFPYMVVIVIYQRY